MRRLLRKDGRVLTDAQALNHMRGVFFVLGEHSEQLLEEAYREHRRLRPIRPPELPLVGEEWRPVVDPRFARRYEVSNKARVKNSKRKTVMRPMPGKRRRVNLYYKDEHGKGRQKPFSVHRLVAAAFHAQAPISSDLEVNHKVGLEPPDANCAINLEIVTHSQNMLHAYAHGLRKPRREKAIRSG